MDRRPNPTKRNKPRRRFPHPLLKDKVIDLEVYRLAERIYWINAFYEADRELEEIYTDLLQLLKRDASRVR